MRCPHCNAICDASDTYCPQCGALLKRGSHAAPAPVNIAGDPQPAQQQKPEEDQISYGEAAQGIAGYEDINYDDSIQDFDESLEYGDYDKTASEVQGFESPADATQAAPASFARVQQLRPNTYVQSSQDQAEAPRRKKQLSTPVLVLLTVFITCLICLGAFAGYNLIFKQQPNPAQQIAIPVEKPAEQPAPSSQSLNPKARMADYSWAELHQISQEIQAASSKTEAKSIAQKYHLLNADGTISTDVIEVNLGGATYMRVSLVGIAHDILPEASSAGKDQPYAAKTRAGLTFAGAIVGMQVPIQATNTNKGGWQSAALRSNLANDVRALFPKELQDQIVPVAKFTNNVGQTTELSSISATTDSLWLFSIAEVAGKVNWTFASDVERSALYNAVLSSEGIQYQRFKELGVLTDMPSEKFSQALWGNQTSSWWTRSSSLSVTARYRFVGADGDPSLFADASSAHGVVVGFCL